MIQIKGKQEQEYEELKMLWMRNTISIYKVWIIVKHQSTTQNSQLSDMRFMKWWENHQEQWNSGWILRGKGKKQSSSYRVDKVLLKGLHSQISPYTELDKHKERGKSLLVLNLQKVKRRNYCKILWRNKHCFIQYIVASIRKTSALHSLMSYSNLKSKNSGYSGRFYHFTNVLCLLCME